MVADVFEVLGDGLWERFREEGFAFGEQSGDGFAEFPVGSVLVGGEFSQDVRWSDGGMFVAELVEEQEFAGAVAGDDGIGFREGEEAGEIPAVGFVEPVFPGMQPAGDGWERLLGGGVEGRPAMVGEGVGERGAGLIVCAAEGDFLG